LESSCREGVRGTREGEREEEEGEARGWGWVRAVEVDACVDACVGVVGSIERD
jgi:hypothetical protein